MPNKPLTISQLRELVNQGECTDPLVFLESVMTGQDPRKLSSIYELIMEIDSFCDGDVSKDDWHEVIDHVMTRFKYKSVSMADSMFERKRVHEYLHPKRKQVELTGGLNGGASVDNDPLTEDEVEMFKEKFNDDF